MRIVAGDFRGRSIDAPQGSGTRPTTDRVREALMSSLYSLLGGFDGQCVLDAFAGSGALGLEALSRGAEKADFFESNKGAFRTLRSNIAACGIGADRASAYNADVVRSCEAGGAPSSKGGARRTRSYSWIRRTHSARRRPHRSSRGCAMPARLRMAP